MNASTGAALSLATGICWAVSPVCFESASRRIGSFRVAYFRSVFASAALFLVLVIDVALTGKPISLPSFSQLLSIVFSGILGLGIGDMLSYQGYVEIGAQKTTLILTLAPVAAVAGAWVFIRESLSLAALLGIALVLFGAALSVLCKNDPNDQAKINFKGVMTAVGGAVFVGLGAVFSREAFEGSAHFNAVFATVLRVASGMAFFVIVNLFRGAGQKVRFGGIGSGAGFSILLGSLMGPIGGMLCYIFAFTMCPAGIVSALAATSPVFLLGIEALRTRSRPTFLMAAATALTVAGAILVVSNMK